MGLNPQIRAHVPPPHFGPYPVCDPHGTPLALQLNDDAEEAFEQTLCQVRTVHVFKIPPRMTSGGYRAGDWKDEVWQGALKVVQKGMACAILLNDPKTSE